jgi:hypothetical protein
MMVNKYILTISSPLAEAYYRLLETLPGVLIANARDA